MFLGGTRGSMKQQWLNGMKHIYHTKKGSVLRTIWKSQDGMGVVEVILIIVVLIGLVIIFQTNIKGVVASIFSTIQKNAGSIR